MYPPKVNAVQRVYMIRDKETGLYSSAGNTVRFTKQGMVFRSISGLSNHLRWHPDYSLHPDWLAAYEEYMKTPYGYPGWKAAQDQYSKIIDEVRDNWKQYVPRNWEIVCFETVVTNQYVVEVNNL